MHFLLWVLPVITQPKRMAGITCDFQLPSADRNWIHQAGVLGKAAGRVLPGPSGQHLLPVIPCCIQPLLYLLEEKTYEEPSLTTLPPTTHLDLAIPTHSSQEVAWVPHFHWGTYPQTSTDNLLGQNTYIGNTSFDLVSVPLAELHIFTQFYLCSEEGKIVCFCPQLPPFLILMPIPLLSAPQDIHSPKLT